MRVKIIRILFVLNAISAILMACCIDSKSSIPIIILGLNLGYMLLVEIANTREG